MTTPPPFDDSSIGILRSPSIYEWLRNYLGLMPLRVSCSTHCWMSDAGWTEWKSYSRPHWDYVTWLPESRPHCVFKSATLGTRSLYASAVVQSGMSTQVRKNVQRLRISKSLTCDDLNELLTYTHVSAMTPLKPSDYDFEVSVTSGRTSSRSSVFVSGNLPWTDDRADPIEDIRNAISWAWRVNRCNRPPDLGMENHRVWIDEANGWLRSKRELY